MMNCGTLLIIRDNSMILLSIKVGAAKSVLKLCAGLPLLYLKIKANVNFQFVVTFTCHKILTVF